MNFHTKALIVGIITVLLCVFAVLWIFVIDKGTLIITGDQGYTVEISGSRLKIPKKLTCNSNPCSTSLPSGYYTLELTKPGYFDESKEVAIKRRDDAPIEISFEYIPTISSLGEVADFEEIMAPKDLPDFEFKMDTTYNKQKISLDGEVLAYFDRELKSPVAFGSETGRYVLVADQGEATILYLIDTEKNARSYLGELPNITTVKWSLDDSKILIAEGNRLWIVDTQEASFEEWAFEFSLEKAVWGDDLKLYFATNKNLAALVEGSPSGTVDILKNLLNGEYSNVNAVTFSIGYYDVAIDSYRLLYEVPESLEIDYENVFLKYDEESDKLYFSNGEQAYEVVREIRG